MLPDILQLYILSSLGFLVYVNEKYVEKFAKITILGKILNKCLIKLIKYVYLTILQILILFVTC